MTSLLTLGLLVLGMAASLFILEAQGRLKPPQQPKPLTRAHRFCGYGFAILFAWLAVVMIYRSWGIRSEYSPRILLHIALAAGMASMLALKILLARRYRKYYSYLPAVGGLLLTGTVIMSTITAGHYFIQRTEPSAPRPQAEKKQVGQVAPLNGAALVQQKCIRCHPLDRVQRRKGTAAEWRDIIDRMARNAEEIGEYGLWTPAEKEAIVRHLSGG